MTMFTSWWVRGAILVAILAAVGLGVWSYNSAIERAALAEARVRQLEVDLAAADVRLQEEVKAKAKLQDLFDEADRLAKAAKAREEEERKRNAKLAENLASLAKQDKGAADWLSTPVPDSVRRLRRGAADPDGVRRAPGVQDPDRTPQPDTGVPTPRRSQWRAPERSGVPALRTAELQFRQAGFPDVDRKEPEMKTVALMFAALILNAAIPEAAAQQPTPPVTLQAAETNFYDAMTAIAGTGADAETKRMAIFAATIARVQEKGGSAAPMAQPQQLVLPKQGRSFWDVVVEVGDRVFSGVERVTPAVLAYAGQRQATKASVQMAEINRDVSIAQSNNFLQLGQAGINGTAQTAQAGFTTLGRLSPSNVYTVSGNANFGPGAFTLTTNTNSGNTTRTCTGGAAGNSGGTAGGAGGAGGAAGC